MDMSDHDVFYLESCFFSHGAPAYASILLITVFIYLFSSNSHSIHLSLLPLLLIEVSSCHSSFL